MQDILKERNFHLSLTLQNLFEFWIKHVKHPLQLSQHGCYINICFGMAKSHWASLVPTHYLSITWIFTRSSRELDIQFPSFNFVEGKIERAFLFHWVAESHLVVGNRRSNFAKIDRKKLFVTWHKTVWREKFSILAYNPPPPLTATPPSCSFSLAHYGMAHSVWGFMTPDETKDV